MATDIKFQVSRFLAWRKKYSAAESADPPLTTVHQDHTEKGIRAGRMLVAQLYEEGAANAGLLATHLVVRGSTSAKRER